MHGPTPPPIVAPPVVQQPASPPIKDVQSDPSPSSCEPEVDHVVRDIKIAIVCLSIMLLLAVLITGNRNDRSHLAAITDDVAPAATNTTFRANATNHVGIDYDSLSRAMAIEPMTTAELQVPIDEPADAQPSIVDSPDVEPIDVAVSAPDSEPVAPEPAVVEDSSSTKTEQVPAEEVADETFVKSDPPVIQSLEMLSSVSETAPVCKDGTCKKPEKTLGTTLAWAESPAEAYRMAASQDKLVFLIHVSGNFEIPGFT